MAQRPNSIGIIDLYNGELAPSYAEFGDLDVFLKCTVSMSPILGEHVANFKPHKTICFSRDYTAIRKSLGTKSYAEIGGTVEEKIVLFDRCKKEFPFDYFFTYDEMITKQTIDLLPEQYYDFPRSFDDLVKFNRLCPWCDRYAYEKWSLGNIHTNKSVNAHGQFHKLRGTTVNIENL